MYKFAICIFVLSIFGADGWKTFHLGREYGGNVKAPTTAFFALPPDEWFTQKLDHFNPTDERVWQQVTNVFIVLHQISRTL